MVDSVPPHHLVGLDAVVITNLSRLDLKKRRFKHRKRKIDPSDCSGLYHQKTKNRNAWIEVFADNLFSNVVIPWLSRYRAIQEDAIGRTLFHEIGHHIDHNNAKERDSEAAAERWGKQLRKAYFRKYYSHLKPLVLTLRGVLRAIMWISRANKKRGVV